ncbi:MAG: mannonate dehydratase [Planctomycetes bacterium]|nr:mannonate dehydratase [Planctomycetota bacterium]MCH9725308.1 mannonate dehydratase [Planctomycetota bacterium]MCH9779472.1 mannonate dehydratase [Planctomycetota bacterium]MCH9792749.1 mannonate dehydratase [Planctomycetota bacterium]MDF1742433.1 mannonate dehydratase [Gimesia sp.]
MQLTSVVTPFTDDNLQLLSQIGVTHVTIRYPGKGLDCLMAIKSQVEKFDLAIAAIEGYLPIENIKLGNAQFDGEIEEMKELLQNMQTAGIPFVCYNFMAGTDWVRTKLDERERGGALVTGFDVDQAEQAVSLSETTQQNNDSPLSADELWSHLERFLKELIPVAEECGVTLAMHPDDPPLDRFMEKARIMNSVEGFERLMQLVPSPANAICFCQGTFAEMGVEIPSTIQRLGPYIKYVHFRDIKGRRERFVETFHDNGPTDMYAAIKAYQQIGFTGPIRPDHVPQLVGEESGEPGYTMQGRLHAFGYLQGLIEAARREQNT